MSSHENVICLSKAHILIEDYDDIGKASNVFVGSVFAKIEKLAHELRESLESEAETDLIRRNYSVTIELKPDALDTLNDLDLFDVRLKACDVGGPESDVSK